MKAKRITLILTIFVVFILVAWFSLNWYKNKPANTSRPNFQQSMLQNTTVARLGNIEKLISGSGRLEPKQNLIINTEVSAKVTDIVVKKGDIVNAGDLLATLSKEQLEIDYLIAKRNYDSAIYDGLPLNQREKELALKIAEANLGKAEVKAPFSGVIADVTINPGEQVSNGKAAFQILDLSGFTASIDISESDIRYITIGQPVRVEIASSPEKSFIGEINEIGLISKSSGDLVTYPVKVFIETGDANLLPGMSCTIHITTEAVQNKVIIPVESVKKDGNKAYVTVVTDDGEKPVEVVLGLSDGMNVAVLSGLEAGTRILRSNYALYLDEVRTRLEANSSNTSRIPSINIGTSGRRGGF